MGLPPTPAELGLDEEGFDELVESLPPWERKTFLDDPEPPKPKQCASWSPLKWCLWGMVLFLDGLLLLVALPIAFLVSVLFMNPIFGVGLIMFSGLPAIIALKKVIE